MALTPDGKVVRVARQRFVRVGQARGDFVVITQGVNAGQEVVSAGAFKLRNGAPIVVDNTATAKSQLDPHPPNR
jgi:membrane fusion protein (multidrug efflux system)